MIKVTIDNDVLDEIECVGIPLRSQLRVGVKLGDALERAFRVTGLNQFAYLFTQITGKDCGCEERKERLNSLF